MQLCTLLLPAVDIVVAIPLAARLVPPNRYYGWRTARAFSSSDAWYRTNAMLGVCLLVAGVLCAGVGVFGAIGRQIDVARVVVILTTQLGLTLAALAVAALAKRS